MSTGCPNVAWDLQPDGHQRRVLPVPAIAQVSAAIAASESVAKETFVMPVATFGQVLTHMRQAQVLNEQVVAILEAVNTLRNRNFGHGMAASST